VPHRSLPSSPQASLARQNPVAVTTHPLQFCFAGSDRGTDTDTDTRKCSTMTVTGTTTGTTTGAGTRAGKCTGTGTPGTGNARKRKNAQPPTPAWRKQGARIVVEGKAQAQSYSRQGGGGRVGVGVGLTSVLRGRGPWRRTCSCAIASAGEGSPLRLLSNEALLRIRRGRGGRGLQVGSVWLDEPGPRARWDLRGVIHACATPWAGPRGRGAVGRLRGSHLFAPPAQ